MPQRQPIDENGTPFPSLYAGRTHDRVMAELLGLAKGMICDGVLSDGEAVGLAQWLRSHPQAVEHYPGNLLAPRVEAMFRDGILDEDERLELADLLRALSGETADQTGELNRSTRLPIDHDATILFDGREFCLTGIFAYGSRKECEREVAARGGICVKMPRKSTHYVVVGIEASAAWVQGDHGTKIEHAVRLKASGHPVAIVAEERWIEAIQLDA